MLTTYHDPMCANTYVTIAQVLIGVTLHEAMLKEAGGGVAARIQLFISVAIFPRWTVLL